MAGEAVSIGAEKTAEYYKKGWTLVFVDFYDSEFREMLSERIEHIPALAAKPYLSLVRKEWIREKIWTEKKMCMDFVPRYFRETDLWEYKKAVDALCERLDTGEKIAIVSLEKDAFPYRDVVAGILHAYGFHGEGADMSPYGLDYVFALKEAGLSWR